MHLDAAQVSQFYEICWHTNQHCETEYVNMSPKLYVIHGYAVMYF